MSAAAVLAPSVHPGPRTRPSTVRLGLSRGRLELTSFFRTKEAVFFTFLFPILLLLLFGSIFDGNFLETDISYEQVLVAGVIATGVMSVSFSSLAMSVAIERDDGTITRLAGTPMPKPAYFIGKVILSFTSALAETALLLVLGVAMFGLQMPTDPGRWAIFAAVFVLGVTSCSLIGIAYGTLPRTSKSAAAIVNPPFVVLQFISGVWIPEVMLPDPLRAVAALFPLKWMAQGFRSVFLPDAFAAAEGSGTWQTPLTIGVLAAWVVGGSVACLLTFRWKTRD
jgi:ABC-2 type transport system permease protein